MPEYTKFDNVEYLLQRKDEFIGIDGGWENNLEWADAKDEEIKAVLDGGDNFTSTILSYRILR
ncbi:hypothetical protein SAMN02910323_0608 [Selenomonas ruminantium]|uniref:Uncharacterized protein n=1 Tax=Selenomonas ruminantium TaxID=971 RepID=A0A1K1M694_SELRU|nr:hypothetical protein SAMN02910323_0608 [Selenomonas ruminantium]